MLGTCSGALILSDLVKIYTIKKARIYADFLACEFEYWFIYIDFIEFLLIYLWSKYIIKYMEF